MTALLSARNLSKHYGSVHALDGVSFDIEEGITGLLGANGAGKSTTLKLFLGLLQPDSGSADFLAVDGDDPVMARQRIGYMPEHDCLPDSPPAAEFLTHMAEVSGLPRVAARVRATDALRHVGLFEERYRPIGTYSTGMKQRVKLAQALVHDPVVILLDEPTAGLDPMGRQEMLDLIRSTGRDFGISMVLSSHLMGDVERTCERVIVLDGGTVMRTGPVTGFLEETETLVIEVSEGEQALVDALAARGLTTTLVGRSLTLEGASGDDYDTVRNAVVDSGALLYRLAPERHSLTEIFERPRDDEGDA
ncbi:MAG TPA: ABC transporter ATP-binding protein [Dehalococcoidia bacterium]|nr:ABC transporter ATP-binding protein [Dehalococcoidia bacterium]